MSSTTAPTAHAAITPEQIQALVSIGGMFIGMAKMAAAMTPTKMDDPAVAFIESFFSAIKPVASQPWVADAINGIVARATAAH